MKGFIDWLALTLFLAICILGIGTAVFFIVGILVRVFGQWAFPIGLLWIACSVVSAIIVFESED